MTMKILWPAPLRQFLSPHLRKKVGQHGKASARFLIEFLEDRSVPAYLPLFGTGEATGYPMNDPGLITKSIREVPYGSAPFSLEAYESVDASQAQGFTLSGGENGLKLYNTQGPVITLGGGSLNLGSGIVFGRASSFGGSIEPGNEILVDGGGSLGIYGNQDFGPLTLTVDAGSRVLLGNSSPLGSSWTIGGSGYEGTGVIRASSGVQIITGNINTLGDVSVGADPGATLIINGSINGMRSDQAFQNFTAIGSGTVLFDNVAPQAVVKRVGAAATTSNQLTFRVELTEDPQADLTLSDLTVANGTANSIQKISSRIFEYSVTTDVAQGSTKTVTASIGANVFKDRAYLNNTASNQESIVVNRQGPFGYGELSHINSSTSYSHFQTIQITLVDGAAHGIDPGTIGPGNLQITASDGQSITVGADPTYNPVTGIATYTISPPTTWGAFGAAGPVEVTVSLVPGSIRSLDGTAGTATEIGSFTIDTVTPVLSVNSGQPLPASSSATRTIDIVSSKPIGSFDPDKFKALNATFDSIEQVNATTMRLRFRPQEGALQKAISLLIAPGAIFDDLANPNAEQRFDPLFLFDTVAPQFTVTALPAKVNASSASQPVQIEFSVYDPALGGTAGAGVDLTSLTLASLLVTGPGGEPITVSNFSVNASGQVSADLDPSQFSGGSWSGAAQGTYSVAVSGMTDLAGNSTGIESLGSILVATDLPTVSLTASQTSGLSGPAKVHLTITAAPGTVPDPLRPEQISIFGEARVSNLISVGLNEYSFDVSPLSSDATISLQVPSGVFHDKAENPNSASNTLFLSFNLNTPLPFIEFSSPTPTNQRINSGVVTFSQPVTLSQLSVADFTVSLGAFTTFSSSPSTDGIHFPFTFTLVPSNQFFEISVNAGIAQSSPEVFNQASAVTRLTYVQRAPIVGSASSIGPINSLNASDEAIPYRVGFAWSFVAGMNLSQAATALTILNGSVAVDYEVVAVDESAGTIDYLIHPPTGTHWTDANNQGHFTIALAKSKIFDKAGNAVAETTLGGFDVATGTLGSSLLSNEIDANLLWINAANLGSFSTPGQIEVLVFATRANGTSLPGSLLDTSIVPDASRFKVKGFNIESVSSSWQTGAGGPYLVVRLSPLADVVGDPQSIGPASIELKANSIFDIYGNPNTEPAPIGTENGTGYLSFLGIDRSVPTYTTTGLAPTPLHGLNNADPVTIRISYEDAVAGIAEGSLGPDNLILTLGEGSTTNQAIITGSLDPNLPNTYIYTLTPKSTYWALGNYTLRFTSDPDLAVWDKAEGQVLSPLSANALMGDKVYAGNQVVGFMVVPNIPTIDALVPDTGTSSTDQITSSSAPEISGTAEPGTTVTLKSIENDWTVTAEVQSDGTWKANFSSYGNFPEGTFRLIARSTDLMGNASSWSDEFPITIDSIAPAVPTIDSFGEDTGRAADDRITGDNTIFLVGTAEPGSEVEIRLDGKGIFGLATADSSGNWVYHQQGEVLGDGIQRFSVRATDRAGNTSASSQNFVVLVDTQAPAAPILAAIAPDSNIDGDEVTNVGDLTLSGSAEAYALVEIFLVGGSSAGSAQADEFGNWSLSLTDLNLSDGSYQFVGKATDPAGNLSAASAPLNVIIDRAAPSRPVIRGFAGDPEQDGLINQNRPTLTGTGEANATITVYLAGYGPIGKTQVDAAGNWVCTWGASVSPAPASLPEGSSSFYAIQSDLAGNPSEQSLNFQGVIDTKAPGAATLILNDDTGASASDGVTNQSHPRFSGVAEPGALLLLELVEKGWVVQIRVQGSGAWTGTFDSLGALPEGTSTIRAQAVDDAGNHGPSSGNLIVVVDTATPQAPKILGIAGDTGRSTTDGVTQTTSIVLNGQADPGSWVEIRDGSNTVAGTVQAQANGTWSFTVPHSGPFTDGSYSFSATSIDLAGNRSAASAQFTVVIDTVNPATPSIDAVSPDTGTPGDGITSGPGVVLSGSAEAGSRVEIHFLDSSGQIDPVAAGSIFATAQGKWLLDVSNLNLAEGTYRFVAIATDLAGNTSVPSAPFQLVLDQTPPESAQILFLTDDSGASASDGVTNSGAIELNGQAEPGSLVEVFEATLGLVGQAQTDANGIWSLTVSGDTPFGDGIYTFTAEVIDVAGNRSQVSIPFTVTVDSKAPSAPLIERIIDDTGIPDDAVTSGPNLLLQGTGELNSVISLYLSGSLPGGDRLLGTAMVGDDGHWSFNLASQITLDGLYPISAQSTDVAGNTSARSATLSLIFDRSAPDAPLTQGIVADDGNDGLIANARPSFTGTADSSAASVSVSIDGLGVVGSAQVDAFGKWQWDWPAALAGLADGNYVFRATATDLAGNTSPSSTPFAFTVDTTSPNLPVIAGITPDTGSSSQDALTSSGNPQLFGTAEPGSRVHVTLLEKGWEVAIAAAVDGTWNADFSSFGTLSDGSWHYQARATDNAGNSSSLSPSFAIIVDSTAPVAPTIAKLSNDSGRLPDDGVTSQNILQFSGQAEPGSTVLLSEASLGLVGQVVADGSGKWTLTVPASSSLADGTYQFRAQSLDRAGNLSASSSLFAVTIDTDGPQMPTIGAVVPDTGIDGDAITATTTPTITGKAEANALVELQIDSLGVVGTVIADASGTWSIDLTDRKLADGTYRLLANATDLAGNRSAVSDVFTLMLDRSAPATPVIVAIEQDPDGDHILTVNRPNFSGSADPFSQVEVSVDGLGVVGRVQADANGKWNFTWPASREALTDDLHTVRVRSIDLAGNASAFSSGLELLIDTRAPAAPVIAGLNPQVGEQGGTPVTDSAKPTIFGQAEPGSTVRLTLAETGWMLTISVGSNGLWSGNFGTFGDLPAGAFTVTARAIDKAGNISSASAAFTGIVIVAPPLGPSFDNAIPLAFTNQTLAAAGEFVSIGDRVFYKVVAPQTGYINVRVAPGDASLVHLALTAYDFKQQAVSLQAAGEQGALALVRFPVLAGQTYYLRVDGLNDSSGSGATGAWMLNGTFTSDPAAANSQTGQGSPVILDSSGQFQARGTIDFPGDGDLLTIRPTVTGNYLVRLVPGGAGSTLAPQLFLVSEGLQTVAEFSALPGQTGVFGIHLEAGQNWYLRIAGADGSTGDFAATIQTDDFGAVESDAGGLDPAGAGLQGSGAIQLPADTDLIRFVPSKTGTLQILVRAADGTIGAFGFTVQTAGASAMARMLADSTPVPAGKVTATEGQPLLLRVEGLDGAAGNYVVEVTQVADDFTDELDPALAQPIQAGQSIAGNLEAYQDRDVFVWSAPADRTLLPPFGSYFASVGANPGSELEATLRIYRIDADGEQQLLVENSSGPQEPAHFQAEPGSTYLFEVSGKTILARGSYRLVFGEDRLAPVDDFGDSFLIANDNPAQHLDEAASQSIDGVINPAADVDVFRFIPNETGKWILRVDAAAGVSLDPFLALYDSAQVKLISNDNSGPGTSAVILADFVAGQRYFLAVSGSSGIGAYKLQATAFRSTSPLPADDSPAGSVRILPAPSGVATQTSGTVDFFGDNDHFSLSWPANAAAATLVIRLEAQTGNLDPYLELVDAQGNLLQASDNTGSDPASTLLLDLIPGQTVFLRASGAHGTSGAYTLRSRVIPLNQPDPFVGSNADQLPVLNLTPGDGNLNSAVPILTGLLSDELRELGDKKFIKITAPIDGLLTLAVKGSSGSSLDPYISAFRKVPQVDGATLLGADDQSGGGLNARLQIRVKAGEQIILLVQGAGGSVGSFDLKGTLRIDDIGDVPASGLQLSQNGLQAVAPGTIESADDADLFVYRADRDGAIIASMSTFSSNLDPYLFVYRASDGALIASNNNASALTRNSAVRIQVDAGETYYFSARAAQGTLGDYTFEVKPILNPFPTKAAEAQLLPLTPGLSLALSGIVNVEGEANWFKFVATESGFLKIATKGQGASPLDTVLGIYNDSGQVLAQSDDTIVSGIRSTNSEISISVLAGRTYLIRVGGYGQSTGTYRLEIGPGDRGSDTVGNTFDTAEYLKIDSAAPAHVNGNLGAGDQDFYRFLVPADADIVVKYSGLRGLLRAFVRDENGTMQMASGRFSKPGEFRFSARAGQEVFLEALSDPLDAREGGNFTLDVQLQAPTLQNLAPTVSPTIIDALQRTLGQSFAENIITGLTDADFRNIRDEITAALIATFKAAAGGALNGSFLILWVDPSDFVLTDAKSQQIGNTSSQGAILENAAASLSQKGALDLVVIPGAAAGTYNLNLFGLGGGRVLAGATLVQADGSIVNPKITLNGVSDPNGIPVGAVPKEGFNLFLDFRGVLTTTPTGSGVIPPSTVELSVAAQQIVNVLISGNSGVIGNISQNSLLPGELDFIQMATLLVGLEGGAETAFQEGGYYNSLAFASAESLHLLSLLKGIGTGIQNSVANGLRLITQRGPLPSGEFLSLVKTTIDRLGLDGTRSLVTGVGEQTRRVIVDTVGENLQSELINKPLRFLLDGIYKELDRTKSTRPTNGSRGSRSQGRSTSQPTGQKPVPAKSLAKGTGKPGSSWESFVQTASLRMGFHTDMGLDAPAGVEDRFNTEAQTLDEVYSGSVEPTRLVEEPTEGCLQLEGWKLTEENPSPDRFWSLAGAAALLPWLVQPQFDAREKRKGPALKKTEAQP